MDQIAPKTGALDSTLLVTMTRSELREMIRAEVQMAIGTSRGTISNPEPSGNQKPNLSVKEAAEIARLAPSTIRLYIRKRQLRALKVGRRVIIEMNELKAFLRRNPIEVHSLAGSASTLAGSA